MVRWIGKERFIVVEKFHMSSQVLHQPDLTRDEDLARRRRILHDYQRRWHPDKNPQENSETATQVSQFLNANKSWFLEGGTQSETASLLPAE